ncbi:hypothetical protein Emed_000866 [Eimeria media]
MGGGPTDGASFSLPSMLFLRAPLRGPQRFAGGVGAPQWDNVKGPHSSPYGLGPPRTEPMRGFKARSSLLWGQRRAGWQKLKV